MARARTLTILYDQATEGVMEPVVIAMSSAFDPFPAANVAGPPPRKMVEYATGVSSAPTARSSPDATPPTAAGHIVVAGHGNADRIADDEDRGLALLRIYGANDCIRCVRSRYGKRRRRADRHHRSAKPGRRLRRQSVKVSVTHAAAHESTLTPAPALGFAGAPALDADGKFAGLHS